jgi:hypothetical protein
VSPVWDDVTGLRVTFMVLTNVDPRARGESNRLPRPIEGPQFCVTDHGFVKGTARTAAELAALGVSAETIAAIEAAAEHPRALACCAEHFNASGPGRVTP